MAEAHEIFEKYAAWYAEHYMEVAPFAKGLDFYLQQLSDPQAQILDIACGPGNIAAYLHKQHPKLHITGIDRAPTMIEIAKQQVPKARFEVLDAYEISNLKTYFDGVVLGFLLPYLLPDRLEDFFKNVKSNLKPGGLIYISTIEGNPDTNGWQTNSKGDKVQMFYYREEDFKQLLRKMEATLLHFEIIDFTKADGQKETNLVAVAQFPDI
ncbi:MAG: class I SAM-dependent methyltransferase [Saprospiraceae bacterium]|nr:class I SAM-dependent methyltransferase [Saprospiraceae bacterium]